MHFSLITPTPGAEREAAIQWAKNPYGDHQWLWRFLAAEPGTARDFLFRRRDGEGSMPGFYVVSARKPQSFSDAWQVQSRGYDPQLQEGQHLAFELRANPVVTHKVNEKARRDDVVMHEKKRLLEAHGFKRWADWPDMDETKPALYELVQNRCLDWLEQRAEQAGFRVLTRELHDEEYGVREEKSVRVDGYTQHQTERKDIRFSTVDFTGELEITNTSAFHRTLLTGIGHAKGFGCGLLLVRRI
jgi:CRISPR system Cascade subunit CasE